MSPTSAEYLQRLIESIYQHERETGILSLDALRGDAAFYVAERACECGEVELLNVSPPWLLAILKDWASVYESTGKLIFISGHGPDVDRSHLGRKLVEIFSARAQSEPY